MNTQFFVKVAVSALIIAAVSEISKRNNTAGTLLASLPLTTLLALVWLWHETHDPARLASWTTDVVWLVLPSLPEQRGEQQQRRQRGDRKSVV